MFRHYTSQSSAATSRLLRRLFPILLLSAVLAAPQGASRLDASPAPASGSASLIYAGWFGQTLPNPVFVSANRIFLESQPFDGLVVYLWNPGLTPNITHATMTNTPVSYQTAMSVMTPMAGLSFTHLTENLGLIMGSTPPDFFNDWSIPIQNFANVAKAAKDSGLRGLCFDNEQYFAPWGDYGSHLAYYSTKTFAEYQAQARLRGRQVMEAMVSQFPDIVFMTLHGPYVSEPDAPTSLQFPQWQSSNELLGPFFAGNMEGAGSTACNVDGGEIYTLRSSTDFQASASWRRNDLASDAVNCAFIPSALRSVWAGRSCISYGVYDRPFGGASMDAATLRTTLANALVQADRYVWFYAEASTYLLPASLGGASDTWVNAIRQARTDAGNAAATPEPLGAPANLAGQAVSTIEISLTWEDRSSAETGFAIERQNGAIWSQIGATPDGNITTYRDTGLSPGTSYNYRVLAFSAAGVSPTSNVVSVTTSASAPSAIPGAPTGLTATSVTTSSVTLTWTDGSSNENGFAIQRLNGSTWSQIGATPDGNITAYGDTGLSPGTSYSYRVLAFNGSGNSPTSNVVSATTSQVVQIPAAPSNLRVAGVTSTSVTLAWTDGSSNENGFSIERKIGSSWVQIGWVPDNTWTFRHGGLNAGRSYTYRVKAFNAAGNSNPTNRVEVRTPSR